MATATNAVEQNELEFDENTPGDEVKIEEGVALKKEEKKPAEEKIDIQIVDDTPEEDRRVLEARERKKAKQPAADEDADLGPLPDTEGDLDKEIAAYGKRSQQRIKQLYSKFHDERRAREAAIREQEEAVKFAQRAATENKQMRDYLAKGETYLIEQVKQKALLALEKAKRDYKEAYTAGDADAIAKAVEAMNLAQIEQREANAFKPLQPQKEGVQSNQSAPVQQIAAPTPRPDSQAVAWAEKNKWFGTDRIMTAFAYGLHEDLVLAGVDPRSDSYYEKINSEMKKRFPEKFGVVVSNDGEKPRNSAPNVVAGVTRTPSSKKVTLTQTQVAVAKRLGVPLEVYAQHVLKEKEQGNA